MHAERTVIDQPGRIRDEPISEAYISLADGRRPYEATISTTDGFRYVLVYGRSRHDAEIRANERTGHCVAGLRVLDPRYRRPR